MKRLLPAALTMAFSSLLLVLAWPAHAADFHVSPKGNDASGNGSAQKPFATPARALAAVRADGSAAGDRVLLHAAEYAIDKTLVLGPGDCGTAEKPFVIEAAPGEKAELSGARVIADWKPADPATPGLDAKAQGKVFCADIPKGWRFHYLFVDGQRAQRARFVNNDQWRRWPKDHALGAPDKKGQLVTFKTNQAALAGLPSNGDVEMVCIMFQYGVMGNGVLTDIDPAAGTAQWNSVQTNLQSSRNPGERGYNLENALKFIDEPGEWAVDSAAGKVWYWPREGENLAKAKVVAPRLYELVRLQGDESKGAWVRHVVMRNLTLKYTDRLPETDWPRDWVKRQWENTDASVYFRGAEDCAVEGCRILHPGAYGVTLKNHAQRVRVAGNEIGWTGSGGVFLEGYGPGTKDENKENVVVRNWIHDAGLGNYWHSACVSLYQSGKNRVALNLLQRSAYSAISMVGMHPKYMSDPKLMCPGNFEGQWEAWNYFNPRIEDYPKEIAEGIQAGTYKFDRETIKPYLHSRENLVEKNLVVEPEQILDEGGAIYAWCTGKANIWRDNIVFKSTGFPGSSILALDDIAEFFTLTGNVIWVNGKAGCGTVGVRATERGNTIKDNVRASFTPDQGDRYMAGGLAKGFYRTEDGRESLDKLESEIKAEVAKAGGWLGNPATGIPAPGEPITKGREKAPLPKDSHMTIE